MSLAVTVQAQAPPAQADAAVVRTVYVTATDGKGVAVRDLKPADFVVKEGGKERAVSKAEPATARMRLALMVEERLTADGPVRQALFDFMKRMQPAAEIALMTVGMRTATVVDYTGNLDALVTALNQFSLNPQQTSNVMEGILSVSSQIERQKAERPVMVVIAASGGQVEGGNPQQVLTQLRQSRATFHAVALMGGGDNQDREQVLLDGAKQSGGRRVDIAGTANAGKALQQIADDLLAQYLVTYELPAGTKREPRLNISTPRHGVSLRAPTAIPDR
jgi:VWFA-related protein